MIVFAGIFKDIAIFSYEVESEESDETSLEESDDISPNNSYKINSHVTELFSFSTNNAYTNNSLCKDFTLMTRT